MSALVSVHNTTSATSVLWEEINTTTFTSVSDQGDSQQLWPVPVSTWFITGRLLDADSGTVRQTHWQRNQVVDPEIKVSNHLASLNTETLKPPLQTSRSDGLHTQSQRTSRFDLHVISLLSEETVAILRDLQSQRVLLLLPVRGFKVKEGNQSMAGEMSSGFLKGFCYWNTVIFDGGFITIHSLPWKVSFSHLADASLRSPEQRLLNVPQVRLKTRGDPAFAVVAPKL